jgi:hypothetical protein
MGLSLLSMMRNLGGGLHGGNDGDAGFLDRDAAAAPEAG